MSGVLSGVKYKGRGVAPIVEKKFNKKKTKKTKKNIFKNLLFKKLYGTILLKIKKRTGLNKTKGRRSILIL